MGTGGNYVDPTNRRPELFQRSRAGPMPSDERNCRTADRTEQTVLRQHFPGWVARAHGTGGRPALSLNAASAIRTSALPGTSHFYGNPGFTIASPNWELPHPDHQWSGNSGSLYGDAFTSIPDPQCTDADYIQVTSGDRMGTNLQASNVCTIVALARRQCGWHTGRSAAAVFQPRRGWQPGLRELQSFR